MSDPISIDVASFNVHAGVDGWGRPYDLVTACGALKADILVLQEAWQPDDSPSQPSLIGQALDLQPYFHALAEGFRAQPDPNANDNWIQPFGWLNEKHSIYVGKKAGAQFETHNATQSEPGEAGSWGIGVLVSKRFTVLGTEFLPLPQLRRDNVRRGALIVRLAENDKTLAVVATHMSHLVAGSPLHYRRLQQTLSQRVTGPAVLCGDMNLWGPPVGRFFHDWTRTVKGRSWPSWRPHSQLDHILIRGVGLSAHGGKVASDLGSDHLPVQVTLTLD